MSSQLLANSITTIISNYIMVNSELNGIADLISQKKVICCLNEKEIPDMYNIKKVEGVYA
jgi:hypothetical protein